MTIQIKAKIKIFLILVCLLTASCRSETLIAGQLTEYGSMDFNPEDFIGHTVYVYPESEIKEFLRGKNSALKEAISEQLILRKKCDELRNKIPPNILLEMADAHYKAKDLADECSAEYESRESSLHQIYFENIPISKLTTTIKDDGSFGIGVPPNSKYVVILPKHSITWVYATGESKFLRLNAAIDTNADVIY